MSTLIMRKNKTQDFVASAKKKKIHLAVALRFLHFNAKFFNQVNASFNTLESTS